MNVHADLSFVNLILHASIVVQAVVLMLVLLSLWSWWQIFLKMFQLRRAARDTDRFEDEFWKGGDLAELYQRTSQSRTGSGMDHIFTAGFREYAKHRKQGSASAITLDSARRALSSVTPAVLPCLRCFAYSRNPAVKMCSSPLPARDLLELWYSSFRSPPFQNSFSNASVSRLVRFN